MVILNLYTLNNKPQNKKITEFKKKRIIHKRKADFDKTQLSDKSIF